MNIEQETFANYLIEKAKLVAYGFQPEGNRLIYTKTLPDEKLKIIFEYDGSIAGKIVDLDMQEEYTAFRVKNSMGFRAEIRHQFVDLLLDIRDKCCINQYFKSEQARRINTYIYERFHGAPEFLWPKIPSFAAYRMSEGKKWYAVVGCVPRNKVEREAPSDQPVEVINVKVDKLQIKTFLSRKGIYPAYHMNKQSWVSVILDDTLPDDEIEKLIKDSYESLGR